MKFVHASLLVFLTLIVFSASALTGTAGASAMHDRTMMVAYLHILCTGFVIWRIFAGPPWSATTYIALALVFAPVLYVLLGLAYFVATGLRR